jgi:2-keto-4-pentenoate hydratase
MEQMLAGSGPATLARCRRGGTVAKLPLDKLASRAEAQAFQAAVIDALCGVPCGYKIGATSPAVQQLLSCREPIYSPVLSEDVLAGGSTFRIPQGFLGVECEFGFVMARDFPASDEAPDAASLRSAIAECFIGLELVGRRLSDDVPLNETSAIADFGLDVAVIRGEPIPDWTRCDLAAMLVRAVLDGITVVTGTGAAVLGHPLNALLWLAKSLQRHGGGLRRGDIIMTGTCTGITKVAPGQTFAGRFADFLPVHVYLT